MLVTALVFQLDTRLRLAEALRRRGAAVIFCESGKELQHVCATSPVGVIFCALSNPASGRSLLPRIRRLRAGFPSVPLAIIAPEQLEPATARDLVTAGTLGVVDVALRSDRRIGTVTRRALAAAENATAERWVARSALPLLGGPGALIMNLLLKNPSIGTPQQIGNALGIPVRTLRYRLERAGAPGVHTLVVWIKVLIASRRLEDPARRVNVVASELGFGSAGKLRAALLQYAGVRTRELRMPGGATPVLQAFARAVHRDSSPASHPGPPVPRS